MTIRVVVVDDQALVRRGFAMVLDHQDDIDVVAEAGNGFEAIEACLAHRPDVVLMDIRMPEMDGLTATRAIRGEDIAQPAIIALTANAFASDEAACLAAGMDGFLTKPLRKSDLMQSLARAAGADRSGPAQGAA